HGNTDRVLRRGITEFHGIFQQLIGHVADRALEIGLALGRCTIVAGKERTEVISEKISREPIVTPALLNGQSSGRKDDLEMLAVLILPFNERAEYLYHRTLSSSMAYLLCSERMALHAPDTSPR